MLSVLRYLGLILAITLTSGINLFNYNSKLIIFIIKHKKILKDDWMRWCGEEDLWYRQFWFTVTDELTDNQFDEFVRSQIIRHCNICCSASRLIIDWELRGILKHLDQKVIDVLNWKRNFE